MSLIKQVYLIFRAILSTLVLIPIAIWRVKWLRYAVVLLLVAAGAGWYWFYGKVPAGITTYDTVYVSQGWTEDERLKYYRTDQGTLIMPYSWFMSLEMPPTFKVFENFELFSSNDNMVRFRLIPDVRPKYNPDLLPVGIAKATVGDDVLDLGLGHKEWLSFSCAACHTGLLTRKGLGVRVDGMPAMWDFSSFSSRLIGTLGVTRAAPTKFDRFAAKVLARDRLNDNAEERNKLRQQIDEYFRWPLIKEAAEALLKKTYPTVEGPGRTDALGRGGNGQFGFLDPAVNVHVGNGPVGFPPLWYTHDYDWVQSTTGIRQPLGRNVTESWGVNAIVDIFSDDPNKLFRSTHDLDKLFWMETLLSVLDHPRWPSEVFGAIDESLAERGRFLYEEAIWENPRSPADEIYCGGDTGVLCNDARVANQKGYCARCHSPVREANTYTPSCDPATDATCKSNPPLWQLMLYRLDVLGTDPNDAKNFNARAGTMSPGKGAFRSAFAQADAKRYAVDPNKPNLGFGIGNGLDFVTTRVMDGWFERNRPLMERWVADGVFPSVEIGRRTMEGFRDNAFRAPLAYPARPMAGYWSSAPFLHNQSVPNLYELLSPVSERSKVFAIGNTEFDPVNVGFELTRFSRGFSLDIVGAGNSNTGHEFSHKKGDPPKPGVIGPLLSEQDRRAIVEYMKKIDDVPPLSPEEAARRRTLLKKMEPYFEYENNAGKVDAPRYAPYAEPAR